MIRSVNINAVANGWYNWLKDQINILDPATKELGEKRAKICETCKHREINNCGICKCYLPAKVVSTSTCPDNPKQW